MNEVKSQQLGMSLGKATARLQRLVCFELAKEAGRNYCFRCGLAIESVRDFSIDHKKDWLHSVAPIELFFDWRNIAFSHLSCNVKAGRKPFKKYFNDAEIREGKNLRNRRYRKANSLEIGLRRHDKYKRLGT